MSMNFCFGEFGQGIFNEDCMAFARNQKAQADANLEAATETLNTTNAEKAEADKKADEASDNVVDAFTAPVSTSSGTSVADLIREKKEKLTSLKLKFDRDSENISLKT